MRMFLAITLALALSACGSKKKSPQAPGTTENAPGGGSAEEEKSTNTPDDADDAKPMGSSDPCEGGE